MTTEITTYDDTAAQLQHILDTIRAGGSYEAYVSAGRDVVSAQNRNRVLLAELSRDVGDDERFSKDIADGNIEARTLRDYRHVVDYYGGAARACRYLDQGAGLKVMSVTASHFGDSGKDEAYAFIEHTLTNRTSYREAVRTLKEGQPRKPTLADELTAMVKAWRALMADVPELLEHAADCESWRPSAERHVIDTYRAKAQAIRDALNPRVVADAAHGGGDAEADNEYGKARDGRGLSGTTALEAGSHG